MRSMPVTLFRRGTFFGLYYLTGDGKVRAPTIVPVGEAKGAGGR